MSESELVDVLKSKGFDLATKDLSDVTTVILYCNEVLNLGQHHAILEELGDCFGGRKILIVDGGIRLEFLNDAQLSSAGLVRAIEPILDNE